MDEQRWELFDTDNDPTECHDLAASQPERLKALQDLWWEEAELLPGASSGDTIRDRGVHHPAAAARQAARPPHLLP